MKFKRDSFLVGLHSRKVTQGYGHFQNDEEDLKTFSRSWLSISVEEERLKGASGAF